MRILDEQSDRKLDTVTLFLTREEALQLRSDLDHLLAKPKLNHTHLSSEDYKKEITVCIYDEKDLVGFHPRSTKLIKEDH
jgi:hypothetical protein